MPDFDDNIIAAIQEALAARGGSLTVGQLPTGARQGMESTPVFTVEVGRTRSELFSLDAVLEHLRSLGIAVGLNESRNLIAIVDANGTHVWDDGGPLFRQYRNPELNRVGPTPPEGWEASGIDWLDLFWYDAEGWFFDDERFNKVNTLRLQETGVFEPPEGQQERLIQTHTDQGWSTDVWGVPDPNGNFEGEDGQRYMVTALTAPTAVQAPQQSIQDMINRALSQVTDLSDGDDPNLQRARALFDFNEQLELRKLDFNESQTRLETALQIVQSPSDYMTLVALYTGALERDDPARVGERIAPLAPILQTLAQQFFLDIPGINEVPPFEPAGDYYNMSYEAEDDEKKRGDPPAPVVGEDGEQPKPIVRESEKELSPVMQARTELGTISPDVVEQIKSPGYVPPPLSGEDVEQPKPILSPVMQARTELGTISPDVVEQIKAGTVEPEPLLGETTPRMASVTQPKVGSLEDLISKATDPRLKTKLQAQLAEQQGQTFHEGGTVPGVEGQNVLANLQAGETVLTPEQMELLLKQAGYIGPTFGTDDIPGGLQGLPSFLNRPRMRSLSELTGGALRPRSLQTQRRQSPTQRMLSTELAKSFGVPEQDFSEEEQRATSIGGPSRSRIRFRPMASISR